jgi:hypothetical protein
VDAALLQQQLLLAVQSGQSVVSGQASSETSHSDTAHPTSSRKAEGAKKAAAAETVVIPPRPRMEPLRSLDAPLAAHGPALLAINGLPSFGRGNPAEHLPLSNGHNLLHPPREVQSSPDTTEDGRRGTSRASVDSTEQHGGFVRLEKRKVQKRCDYTKYQKQSKLAVDPAQDAQSDVTPSSLATEVDFPAPELEYPAPMSTLFLPDDDVPLPQKKRQRIDWEENEASARIWELTVPEPGELLAGLC